MVDANEKEPRSIRLQGLSECQRQRKAEESRGMGIRTPVMEKNRGRGARRTLFQMRETSSYRDHQPLHLKTQRQNLTQHCICWRCVSGISSHYDNAYTLIIDCDNNSLGQRTLPKTCNKITWPAPGQSFLDQTCLLYTVTMFPRRIKITYTERQKVTFIIKLGAKENEALALIADLGM